MNANEEQASDLIQAISNYEQDHGHFPAQLDAVVPTYLAGIPQTVEGQDFAYKLDDRNGYSLCFHIPRKKGWGCCYIPCFEFWDCAYDDGD